MKELVSSAKNGADIFVSVPNQEMHDLDKNPHKFHFRHYRHDEFLSEVPDHFQLVDFYGQNVYKFDADGICTFELLQKGEMVPVKNVQGQVNIYHFRVMEAEKESNA